MSKALPESKRAVTVFLSNEDFDRLTELCKERSQSRADFLRAAMQVPEAVPIINTRPLTGACLARHEDRLAREKRTRKAKPKQGKG